MSDKYLAVIPDKYLGVVLDKYLAVISNGINCIARGRHTTHNIHAYNIHTYKHCKY